MAETAANLAVKVDDKANAASAKRRQILESQGLIWKGFDLCTDINIDFYNSTEAYTLSKDSLNWNYVWNSNGKILDGVDCKQEDCLEIAQACGSRSGIPTCEKNNAGKWCKVSLRNDCKGNRSKCINAEVTRQVRAQAETHCERKNAPGCLAGSVVEISQGKVRSKATFKAAPTEPTNVTCKKLKVCASVMSNNNPCVTKEKSLILHCSEVYDPWKEGCTEYLEPLKFYEAKVDDNRIPKDQKLFANKEILFFPANYGGLAEIPGQPSSSICIKKADFESLSKSLSNQAQINDTTPVPQLPQPPTSQDSLCLEPSFANFEASMYEHILKVKAYYKLQSYTQMKRELKPRPSLEAIDSTFKDEINLTEEEWSAVKDTDFKPSRQTQLSTTLYDPLNHMIPGNREFQADYINAFEKCLITKTVPGSSMAPGIAGPSIDLRSAILACESQKSVKTLRNQSWESNQTDYLSLNQLLLLKGFENCAPTSTTENCTSAREVIKKFWDEQTVKPEYKKASENLRKKYCPKSPSKPADNTKTIR